MKQTINLSQFHDAFINYNREDNFSWKGRRALFEYLENLEDDTGTEIELDVISLCCDFSESTWEEFKLEYPNIESLEELGENTTVIMVDDDQENPTFIYGAF